MLYYLKMSKCYEDAQKAVYWHQLLWFIYSWKILFSVWADAIVLKKKTDHAFFLFRFCLLHVSGNLHGNTQFSVQLGSLWHHKGHWHFAGTSPRLVKTFSDFVQFFFVASQTRGRSSRASIFRILVDLVGRGWEGKKSEIKSWTAEIPNII